MAKEGRISRAMAKAGGDDKLSPQPGGPAPGPASAGSAGAALPAGALSFEPVRGCGGEPAPAVVMVHDKTGEVASQIRALRARVLALNDGKPPRTIAISSGAREEGKTTMAFNLAAALRETDPGRVVVVDGDMPAPGLHLLANVRAETGLNEMLNGKLELNGNVYETTIPGLDIVPARPFSDTDDYEGPLARQCKRLLAELRKHYSYIVIDTPPVLSASQAAIFGKHSDGVIVVARLEKTPREVVKRAIEELTHSGATVVGCVLTHRKHHVPAFVYRLFSSSPGYYYGSRRTSRKKVSDTTPGPPADDSGTQMDAQ